MTSPLLRNIALILVVAFGGSALALAADEPTPKVKTHKKVVIKEDGKEPIVLDDEDLDLELANPEDSAAIALGDAHLVKVKRGFLGVGLIDLTPELREHFGVASDVGVMVSRVEPDSPAIKAGLKVGDVITAFGSEKIDSSWALQRLVRGKKEAETVPVEVWRERKVQTVPITIAQRERPQMDLGEMFLPGPAGKNFVFRFNEDQLKAVQENAERLKKEFDSPEFKDRIRKYMDLEKQNRQLEQKMKELEQKMKELEKRMSQRSSLLDQSQSS